LKLRLLRSELKRCEFRRIIKTSGYDSFVLIQVSRIFAHSELSLVQSMLNMQSLINGENMASITIRDIDERFKARLRVQAAHHGRSMEEEARDILRTALSTGRLRKGSLVDSIRARIEPLGGVELEIAPRESIREPVNLDT
jgi:plasmid stability protein